MANPLSKLWSRTAKKPPVLSEEEQRHAGDAAKLAEYKAFDEAVGAVPSQQTLTDRFKDAAYKGHTRVIEDTIQKGLQPPTTISSLWFPPGGKPVMFESKPVEVAARREWADTVEVLLKVSDDAGLQTALHAAEDKKNIGITRAIHGEIARRANPASTAEDPMALQTSIKVGKPLQI